MKSKVGSQWKEEMVTLTENFEQRLQVTLLLALILILILMLMYKFYPKNGFRARARGTKS